MLADRENQANECEVAMWKAEQAAKGMISWEISIINLNLQTLNSNLLEILNVIPSIFGPQLSQS